MLQFLWPLIIYKLRFGKPYNCEIKLTQYPFNNTLKSKSLGFQINLNYIPKSMTKSV